MPLPFLLAAAAAPSVLKGISGVAQMIKGNKLAKQNVRPTYEIPQEFRDNLAMAENMAQVGLPQQQYNNAINNISRNQVGALGVLSRSANPGAGVAASLRVANDATLNLDAQDAAARVNNQRFAIGQRGILGQQQLAKQNWDKMQRYQENAQAAAALKGAGMQNAFGALDGLSQLGVLNASGAFNNGSQGLTDTSTPQLSPLAQVGVGIRTQPVVNRPMFGGAQPLYNNGVQWGYPNF